jgi:phenylpyruvate tautomerase
MPTLNLITNVKIADTKAFALEFSKFGAEILAKPEGYISVIITYNETFTFAGTFDPAISLRIDSLDNINREANEKYSKAFFDFFQEKLSVPANRGYITYIDPGRENMGYNGTTFATIFGSKY